MSEEISLEELEKELRELERNPEESIEIKPSIPSNTLSKEEKDVEELENELRKVEEEKEKETLMMYGGVCHRIKIEKFEDPVVVCRYGDTDLMKQVVKLLYKYYPYASKVMSILDEIRPCRAHPRNPDVVMFLDPVRFGSLHFWAKGEGVADLTYIHRLDGDNMSVEGVHLELEITKNEASVRRVCRLVHAEPILTTMLRALNLPFVSETVEVSV
jgi:hypothetical protein